MQIVEQFPHRPTVQPFPSNQTAFSGTDEARIIHEKVLRGLADVAAGRVLSAEIVEAECEALFG
ncbi:hypothetical protein [Pandoraea oxalativorans]|uniref:Uncharacterized protein n=1 Tax=Pandoraea oxalativorans TaxID=573737 RepID=A0A0E3U610_9BURK|nr:hypothetical protein [Pandoraea oxalativorans]AKC69093.1 hypothetical protein MB84_05880 [Pandoraea oxalativorans]